MGRRGNLISILHNTFHIALMFAKNISEATSFTKCCSNIICRKANIIQKSLICLVDKSGFFVGEATDAINELTSVHIPSGCVRKPEESPPG